jgi:hypothetical protein
MLGHSVANVAFHQLADSEVDANGRGSASGRELYAKAVCKGECGAWVASELSISPSLTVGLVHPEAGLTTKLTRVREGQL